MREVVKKEVIKLLHAGIIYPMSHSEWLSPSAVWGLDLVGSLQKAAGGYTNLLVAIDKFSKWTEARPITNIRSEQAILFFADIINWFGIPNVIITDNGTQFTCK